MPTDDRKPEKPKTAKKAKKHKTAKKTPKKTGSKARKRVRKRGLAPKKDPARRRREQLENHARAARFNTILDMDDAEQRALAVAKFERTHIRKDLLEKEAFLQSRVWVQYGYMGSIEKTRLFAQEFIAAYRRAADPTGEKHNQPIKANLFQNSRGMITSLYEARQEADRRGMPYDLFNEILIQGKLKDRWKQPPMPNQLLSGRHTKARLRTRPNREDIATRLFQPHWDRRFFMDSSTTTADPVRAAAMRELYADVMRADDRSVRLAKYLSIRGLLDVAQARSMFEGPLVDAALPQATIRGGLGGSPPTDIRPGCFGNRIISKDSPCKNCVVSRYCKLFRAKVTGALIADGGSGDPVLDRTRELGAARQQKWRQKQAEKAKKQT